MNGTVEFEDVSGTPRPIRDLEDALAAIQREIVTNHRALMEDGTPAILHYIVISDALKELIAIRKLIEMRKSATSPQVEGLE